MPLVAFNKIQSLEQKQVDSHTDGPVLAPEQMGISSIPGWESLACWGASSEEGVLGQGEPHSTSCSSFPTSGSPAWLEEAKWKELLGFIGEISAGVFGELGLPTVPAIMASY